MSSALPQYGRSLDPKRTMRAMVLHRYGGPEVLSEAQVPRPVPKSGQVLVRTRFVGVNPKDVIVRKGKFAAVTGKRFPLIIGHDIAGEVVQTKGRCDLAVGERVYGMINDFAGRAYAEYAAVDVNQLGRAPASIDLKAAAAVPLAAQTALQALRNNGRLRPGQRVLINGASGGVGVFAVQIARIVGAEVTAVCSKRNADFVAGLGAQRLIDYGTTELPSLSERFDLIFDVFGNYHFDALKRLLAPRGTYVHTIPSPRIAQDVIRTLGRKQRAKLVLVRSRRKQLDWLSEQIDAGQLKVPIDRTFPLRQASEAHRFIETKRARGKVVLEVDG